MLEPPAKALRNPLRVRIAAACSERELTAEEFALTHRISVRAANNHFRALEKAGFLRHREVQVRGVLMHVYRTAAKPVITDPEFAKMSMEERQAQSESGIRDYFKRCWAALKSGALDSRDDSHLSWMPLVLDEEGWTDAVGLLALALERLHEIQAESSVRLGGSDEPSVATIFSLAGFEAAPVAFTSPTKGSGR